MRRPTLSPSCVVLGITCLLAACSGDDERPGKAGVGASQEAAKAGEAQLPGVGEPEIAGTTNANIAGGSPKPPTPGQPVSSSADLEAIRANLGDPSMDPLPVPAAPSASVRLVKPVISLSLMLDRVWGIRLPRSTAGYALEARIGQPPYTLTFTGMPDPDLPELFPRELVVVVNKEKMIVNDVKVADVIERTVEDGKGKTWEVPKAEGSFRIHALTAQLEQYRGFRSTLLRAAGIPPELSEGCDLATLVMDEDLPFRFLAEVVLSAGHADIFRFRLATRSLDGLLSYQVITAPRLDPRLVEATNLLGDEWWRSAPPQSRDFEFAYINYIATASPDDWSGECEQDLGVCIPPDLAAWDDLMDRRKREELSANLDRIRAASQLSECRAGGGAEAHTARGVGAAAPPTTGGVGAGASPTGDGEIGAAPEEPGTAKATVGEPKAGEAAVEEVEVVPAGTLVVAPERAGARVPFIYLRQDGAYLVLYDMDRLEAVRSELFGAEKLDLMVSTLKEVHPGPGVLHLGGDLDVPISRLVEVADLLRHRCRIQSMSGRCLEQERWLASVVLFASPTDRFGLMPEPAPAPDAGPEPYHPARDEGEAPLEGVCPLKEIQEAAATRLGDIRVCLGPMAPTLDITLSLRWHATGRLDLVATAPPLPAERVRCIKAAFTAPAPTRETGCDAALLIKAKPHPAG
ncbi:MAG: hypothetical protein ABIK09_20275 [Pseudomonadota bacterium]